MKNTPHRKERGSLLYRKEVCWVQFFCWYLFVKQIADDTGTYLPSKVKGQEHTGQDRTGQDRTGQDRTGQDWTV